MTKNNIGDTYPSKIKMMISVGILSAMFYMIIITFFPAGLSNIRIALESFSVSVAITYAYSYSTLSKKVTRFFNKTQINSIVLLLFAVYIILIIKYATIAQFHGDVFFITYSLAVSFYILSRFGIALLHKHDDTKLNMKYRPTVSFCVPSMNEGENIRDTLLKISESNYPKSKFDIIAINDGSTDNTLNEMKTAQRIAKKNGVKMIVVNWKTNKGKREGMAECARRSKNTILIYVDSDSLIEPDTAKHLVKYFPNKMVGAVAGHAYAANAGVNVVTKMQAVRYYVAFKAYKGAESLFGTVTCCSGCCSAYRRTYVMAVLEPWLNQQFLGTTCTYGDDRSLTNYLLKNGYRCLYSEKAIAHTYVPDTFKKFMKQQLRWKKSWVRESLIAGSFMWKRHPIMSLGYYLGVILPLLAPIIVFRALVYYPITTHRIPMFYIFGLLLMALVYGLYYKINTRDNKWFYGSIFAVFYTIVLIWQLPWAILNLRDTRWGTR